MCFIMSRPIISVILPVYNVEDYLSETMDSILNQSMIDDIEVIMVDDGSTDRSRYIIEQYALDYSNFHAFHKENEGQGIARNYALEIAKGDYIHFLDSDDYMPPEAYETLYSLALKSDCDFAIGNVLRFARYNAWQDNLFKNSLEGIDEVVESTTLNDMPSLVWDTITCNKLYKRQFLLENDIRFPDKKIAFEDIPFSLKSYILADRISITPEVCYYWRLRSDHTSTTQQDMEVSSFRDRLEILRSIHEMMAGYGVSEEITNRQYSKWLSHDLKFFIKRFDHFPEKCHMELFDEIRQLVELMPREVIEGLNSYKRTIYEMILANDFDGFVRLAPLEDELGEDPHIPDFIDKDYEGYFDFKRVVRDEELMAEVSDVSHDESNIYIKFTGKLNYLTEDNHHEESAVLMENDCRFPLEAEDSTITIPISFIKNKNHARIEVSYIFEDFEKSAILKNRQRKSLKFDDFYFDLDTGIDSHLYLDIRKRLDKQIEITDITYRNGQFILNGACEDEISELYVENIIRFDQIPCPDEGGLTFRINENDLSNAPVKKWEINCHDAPNSVRLSREFGFYNSHNKIRFINSRNKILIENDICNPTDELNALKNETIELKSRISSLRDEKSGLSEKNKALERENSQLNDRISEFKSRKAVKFADKLKLN